MKVEIWLKDSSKPIKRVALCTYVKGPFYCVDLVEWVEKWPIADIWRVREGYLTDLRMSHGDQ